VGRGTFAGFYASVFCDIATLLLLSVWGLRRFRAFTATEIQLWTIGGLATILTVVFTSGIGANPDVIAMARKIDAASVTQRNMMRLRVWVFYLASASAVYVTLTKCVYLPIGNIRK